MQTVIVLTILSSLLGLSLAFSSPDHIKAVTESLAGFQDLQELLSQSIPNRAGEGGIRCYDIYIPRITAATEMSKTATETCRARAESSRHDELNKVKEQRQYLDNQVIYMKNIIKFCLGKLEDLEYLKCLKDCHVNLLVSNKDVSKISSQLSEHLICAYKNIACSEDICIKNVLAKSKKDTDDVLVALKKCLLNQSNQQWNLKEFN